MRKMVGIVLFAALLLALCSNASGQEDTQLIVVDADYQTLTLYINEEKIKTWPCAVGKSATPSPLGVWKVNHKAVNWGTGFGSRWIGFYCPWGKFGIHGTNKPGSIGTHASHGCVRMLNRDVEELYRYVRVGAKVSIERSAYGPMAAGLRTLAPGDRGADVAEVQLRLKNLGFYYGNPDGVYGEGTKQAVINYRKQNGLPLDDSVTWGMYQSLGIMLFE